MDIAQYVAMKRELELLQALSEADEDIKSGRVAPVAQMFDNIRKTLAEKSE